MFVSVIVSMAPMVGREHESAEAGTLDEQAEAAEATHRALQDRLADLGGD